MPEIPADVLEKVRAIFAACNLRTTELISMNPNTQEEWLDHVWISEIVQFSSPHILSSGWAVKVEAHFLGGMRHFERWEIADIGMLVHLRLGPKQRQSKVVLLQSKRLYPHGAAVREDTRSDYLIGLGRLADPEDDALSIAFATDYRFTTECHYGAIRRGDPQVARIDEYERRPGFRVHYQLYNPWTIPLEQTVPIAGYARPEGCPEVGVRVLSASLVHARLEQASTQALRARDLEDVGSLPTFGWRLEDFVATKFWPAVRARSTRRSMTHRCKRFSTGAAVPSPRPLPSRSRRRTLRLLRRPPSQAQAGTPAGGVAPQPMVEEAIQCPDGEGACGKLLLVGGEAKSQSTTA